MNWRRDGEYTVLTPDAQVFMNIVLDEAVEEKNGGEKVKLGMVVRKALRVRHCGEFCG